MSKFRKALVSNKGFTLIELLVVIAVLGILAAIAIPRLTGVTDKARRQNLVSSGNTIRSTIEMVIAEEGSPPEITRSTGKVTISTGDASYEVTLDNDYTIDTGALSDPYSVNLNDNSGNTVTITPTGVN